jgi:4-amino-4-deoxy-L-arabinose transferase-like glycosyltransferase
MSEAFILCALAAITVLLRIPFWSRPLDMDEGLYAYGGWQMLYGLVPYRDLYDFKPPGAYFWNALVFALFSPDAIWIYIGAALAAAATSIGVYAVARHVWDRKTALICATLFAIFSSSPHIQGGGVNTEIFMIPPCVWGLYFVLRGVDGGTRRDIFLSGVLFGVATLFKQVAGIGLIAGLIALIMGHGIRDVRRALSEAALIVAGFVLPWFLSATYFLYQGAFREYVFWVFQYPFLYMGFTRAAVQRVDILGRFLWVFRGSLLLWLFSCVAACFFVRTRTWKEWLIVVFLFLSFLGVASGSNFFPHYFIQLVPALALLAGYGIVSLYRRARRERSLASAICLAVLLLSGGFLHVFTHARVYTTLSGDQLSEYESGWAHFGGVFGVAKRVGLHLREVTTPGDEVLVWKHHPEINFYALRRTPSRAPIISLPHLRQDDILLQDIERRRPEYIVILDALPIRDERLGRIIVDEYVKVYGIPSLPSPHQGIYAWKEGMKR